MKFCSHVNVIGNSSTNVIPSTVVQYKVGCSFQRSAVFRGYASKVISLNHRIWVIVSIGGNCLPASRDMMKLGALSTFSNPSIGSLACLPHLYLLDFLFKSFLPSPIAPLPWVFCAPCGHDRIRHNKCRGTLMLKFLVTISGFMVDSYRWPILSSAVGLNLKGLVLPTSEKILASSCVFNLLTR